MLNQPNKYQVENSGSLVHLIKEKIKENDGWISFEEYMALALYAPGLGYYSAGSIKFGEAGDFITAPLLGKQFAGCLAKQCIEIIDKLPCDQSTTIVEFGAGTGQLALDFLTRMDSLGSMPDRYLIIETSADLKHRQKALFETRLPEYLDSVKWLHALPEDGITGVIIANEVLDALPVMRFQIDDDGQARELGVSLNEGLFTWKVSPQPISNVLQDRLNPYSLSRGYRGEINRQAEGWVRSVGENLNTGINSFSRLWFTRRLSFITGTGCREH